MQSRYANYSIKPMPPLAHCALSHNNICIRKVVGVNLCLRIHWDEHLDDFALSS